MNSKSKVDFPMIKNKDFFICLHNLTDHHGRRMCKELSDLQTIVPLYIM